MLALYLTALALSSQLPDRITLTTSNHVAVTGMVLTSSVTRWTKALAECSADPMYLYINSPGGSVVAGHSFINALEHKISGGQHIICVADFAASMAFAILQACPERIVMGHSIAMQHQISLMVGGSLGETRSRMRLADQMEAALVARQAERLNLSHAEFVEKTRDDWWLYGEGIVQEKAADKVLNVGCSPSLIASRMIECPITASGGTSQGLEDLLQRDASGCQVRVLE